jgi:YVTN family beta-propeller protein
VSLSAAGEVRVVDPANPNTITTIQVGKLPIGVAVTPDGSKLYVANSGDGNVSVIDTATNTVIGSPISVGSSQPLEGRCSRCS